MDLTSSMFRHSIRCVVNTILLCLILYQSIGSVLLYGMQMMEAKRSMHWMLMQSIPPERLTMFTFHSGDPLFRPGEREFEYRGEMYDVVRTVHRSDSVIVLALKDVRESDVRRSLVESVSRRMDHDPAAQQTNQSFGEIQDLRYMLLPILETNPISLALRHPPLAQGEPLTHYQTIEVPPPEPAS